MTGDVFIEAFEKVRRECDFLPDSTRCQNNLHEHVHVHVTAVQRCSGKMVGIVVDLIDPDAACRDA